jgi:large subunit ribosomal protein L6
MSRIGRKPIQVPAGVSVELSENLITVKGPKAELVVLLMPGLRLEQSEGVLQLSQIEQNPETIKSFGLVRTLLANAITGTTEGFTRQLEINGVGYKASVSGRVVNLNLGFSHPIAFNLPEGVTATVEKNIVTIAGYDKQAVGQVAANIRALKKPEPYKGKGIKYIEEHVRRKAGKTAAKG